MFSHVILQHLTTQCSTFANTTFKSLAFRNVTNLQHYSSAVVVAALGGMRDKLPALLLGFLVRNTVLYQYYSDILYL